MADGFLRHMAGDRFDVANAGTEQTEGRSKAIEAMRKWDVDVSGRESKTLDQFVDERWDQVITVCDAANESCPVFPGARHRLHWSFPDPSAVSGPDRQAAFDAVAAGIHDRFEEWTARAPGQCWPGEVVGFLPEHEVSDGDLRRPSMWDDGVGSQFDGELHVCPPKAKMRSSWVVDC